jgi:hypothetical protein
MAAEKPSCLVSLRPLVGPPRLLPVQELAMRDGTPEPIEHEGTRYAYSHSIATPGYDASEQPIHVFVELPV